jgi:transporter family-2 protein
MVGRAGSPTNPLERVGPPDLELRVFVEIEQKHFAPGVEVVARVGQNPTQGVLDLDAGHELALALASLAFRGTPGGAVVAPAPAVGAIPESRIADRYSSHASDTIREAGLNYVVLLAVSAGMAIALQVTVNSIGLRDLGIGGLIGVSGLATAAVGLLTTLMTDRPEYTGKALLCALVSGVLGAFILGSIVLAAGHGGVARTLSLVIASQLIAGLLVDRAGLLGAAPQEIGTSKILGIALILIGGVLVVRT